MDSINIYCTADIIGNESGGGKVTFNEMKALSATGNVATIDGKVIYDQNPFIIDYYASKEIASISDKDKISIAHFYAGGFSNTINLLKSKGVYVTYTAAAHDISDSIAEHKKLGVKFEYEHLTDPKKYAMYIDGYIKADICICPSEYSASIMKSYGCKLTVVIPHGCNIPTQVKPLPNRFTVGYLGAVGPDKGLIYLLKAWELLDLKDATLVIAGRHSISFMPYIRSVKRGNIQLKGWVNNISDFYDSISVYVQPSVTEGFGIEVIEAMAHGRPVIASDGCGAHECIADSGFVFKKRDIDDLAQRILDMYNNHQMMHDMSLLAREYSILYDWTKVREQYSKVWMNI